ncbi:unnamed protein product [Caenorhabditis angaria]|uniref:G-protein coupled receptors family 1 profile domain-containing protein n=1 Tax=Caenorhabditis angaria TaxID=860376 RepID=A0A9P1IKM6_9PELO|nr:unnamed protein product [Caenorhabditis angaria]
MNNDSTTAVSEEERLSEERLKLWVFLSKLQFWIILVTVIISLVVIAKTIFNLFQRKRSNYFLFLSSICLANIISLCIILFDIFNFSLKGELVCKLELFLSNCAACFTNWIWLCLFTQRFFILFYPMKRSSSGFFGFMRSAKKLISATAIFALITQSWFLVFITEIIEEGYIGMCDKNPEMLSDMGYRFLAIGEALVTYVFPFLLTIIMDFAVLYQAANSSFVVMSAENIRTERSTLLQVNETVKIQSSESIKASSRRRHVAVRRCLLMATVQVLLNAPYYTLQLLDEVYNWREASVIYLYLDAVLYFIYLTQFAMVFFYTNFLVAPRSKGSRKIPLSYTTSVSSGVISLLNGSAAQFSN